MGMVEAKLTVLFDNPFWIGIFEYQCEKEYAVCKVTFGSEPKDCEIYEFILKNWNKLIFSQSVKVEKNKVTKINPKRLQRIIKKETSDVGIGTKAQRTLAAEHEKIALEHKSNLRQIKQAEKDRKHELKKEKHKKKHNGH